MINKTKYSIVWEVVNWDQKGGMNVNLNDPAVRLICEEAGFEIMIRAHRSQFENKQLAMTLFELYLDEIQK